MIRVNVWSSPRNLSTAMMYSWRQRGDTTVVDEPLYAHYLAATGREHPGADEVLAAQSTDGAAVVRDVMLGAYETPVVVFKQMAKHLVGLDRGFLTAFRNVLLTRDPFDMLTSFQERMPDATLDDTGFPEMIEILDTLVSAGERPIVVDSKLLLIDPPGVLAELCDRLGLEFSESMLTWPAGPKPEDGVWAKHWYDSVHRSTGWQRWAPKQARLLPGVEAAYEASLPLYERLMPYRIG
jgi:hypothetical protein